MGLITSGRLRERGRNLLDGYSTKQASAARSLNEEIRSYKETDRFDLFLSHRFNDLIELKGLVDILHRDYGLKVYIDSWVDADVDRAAADRETGELIRKRMKQCNALVYAQTKDSDASRWMPWECGYFDGSGGRVAIMPIPDFDPSIEEYTGAEYLGIYPWISERKTVMDKDMLYVWETKNRYLPLKNWCNKEEYWTFKER